MEDSSKQLSRQLSSRSEEIIDKLKAIFSYYASFGDRMNINLLKSNKFHKMMVDANLENTVEEKKSLDLIFCSKNKHRPNMSFDTFLDCIPDIALFKYSEQMETAAPKLISQFLLPLY